MPAGVEWLLLPLLLWSSVRASTGIAARTGSPSLAPAVWMALSGLAVVIVTETLSACGLLERTPLLIAWTAITAAGLMFPKASWSMPAPREQRLAWGLIAMLLLATFVIGLIAAPNNADSLGYHNARVMQWWDRHSVAHFITTDPRQTTMPPLASFFRLQSFALFDSDVFFNLTQWLGYAFSIIISAIIAFRFTQNRRAALLAAMFCATLPMAVLQSMNTQIDLIASAYALAAALALVDLWESGSAFSVILFWTLLGLGALVKGTFYFSALTLAAASIPAHLRLLRAKYSRALLAIAIGVSLAAGANAPHFYRNYTAYHEIVPEGPGPIPKGTWTHGSPVLAMKRATSTLLRTAVLQFDFLKKVPGISRKVAPFVERIETAMGLPPFDPDIQLNDGSNLDYFMKAPLPDEDYAGSAWHFIWVIATGAWLLSRREKKPSALFAAALISSLLIIFSVKWMPWNNRLLLPSMLLFAPAAGAAAASKLSRRAFAVFCAFLFPVSLFYILCDYSHPILARNGWPSMLSQTRWERYFDNHDEHRLAIEKVFAALPSTCSLERPAGLMLDGTHNDYYLWIGARHFGRRMTFQQMTPAEISASNAGDLGRFCARIGACEDGVFCLK